MFFDKVQFDRQWNMMLTLFLVTTYTKRNEHRVGFKACDWAEFVYK